MIKSVMLMIIMALSHSLTPLCTYTQLLTKYECEKMLSPVCFWNFENLKCEVKGSSNYKKFTFICDGLLQQECSKLDECAWANGWCTIFTGCTTFKRSSDSGCKTISKFCTSDGIRCVEIGQCMSYLTSKSCKVNKLKQLCYWQENKCIDLLDCDLLSKSLTTEQECRDQLSYCTIGENYIGCVLSATSCELQHFLYQCSWNRDMSVRCYMFNQSCYDRICSNASIITNTHVKCQEYSNKCTAAGQEHTNTLLILGGCQDLAPCSTYIKEDQCHFDAFGNACIWDGSACFFKSCTTASKSEYTTDEQCGYYLSQCTVEDSGSGCKEYIITCDNAPLTLITENECQLHLNECTTKLGGGCVKKTTCLDVNVQNACTTDINGKMCFWVNNFCRDKSCEDYLSTSYQACQLINSNCMYDLNGFCKKLTICSQIFDFYQCKIGTDGHCMWITDYQNNGLRGACIQYSSCKSLPWKTHAECQEFSDKCTTNGKTCVPITSCDETNINGCFKGNDGNCMLIIDPITIQQKCVQNNQCKYIQANTHQKCHRMNSKCTTNGTECIDLGSCFIYTQAGCYLNDVGIISIDGKVSSTGKCVWDTEANLCRDFSCQDVISNTDAGCSQALSFCTTYYDRKCVIKKKCSEYVSECPEKCRSHGSCYDIQCYELEDNTDTTEDCHAQLPGCISDGDYCIERNQCSNYLKKWFCDSGGTDGICYFDDELQFCMKITQCEQASNNSFACSIADDRCIEQKNICIPLTCQNQFDISKICTHYFDFQYTVITYCQRDENMCVKINETKIDETNCFTSTQYRNSWNEKTSTCQSCFYNDKIEIINARSQDCNYSKTCVNETMLIQQISYVIRLIILIIYYL